MMKIVSKVGEHCRVLLQRLSPECTTHSRREQGPRWNPRPTIWTRRLSPSKTRQSPQRSVNLRAPKLPPLNCLNYYRDSCRHGSSTFTTRPALTAEGWAVVARGKNSGWYLLNALSSSAGVVIASKPAKLHGRSSEHTSPRTMPLRVLNDPAARHCRSNTTSE